MEIIPVSCGFKVVKKDGKFINKVKIYDNNKTVFNVDQTGENPMDIEKLLVKILLIKNLLKCNGVNGQFQMYLLLLRKF